VIRLRNQGRRVEHECEGGGSSGFDDESKATLFAQTLPPLAFCNEIVLGSSATIRRQSNFEGETILYVRRGTIRYADSAGRLEVICAGAFARIPTGHDSWCTHENKSASHNAQAVEIGLSSTGAALEAGVEQRRFTAAQRRSTLCIVASPDGRQGSLPLAANVTLFSTLLLPGQHIVHESNGRGAWLQVLEGELTIGEAAAVRDSVGDNNKRALQIRAIANSELLLIDMGR